MLRADFGTPGGLQEVRGAANVVRQAVTYARMGLVLHPALVNGALGGVATRDGEPFSVGAITVRDGKIVAMDFFADPERPRPRPEHPRRLSALRLSPNGHAA